MSKATLIAIGSALLLILSACSSATGGGPGPKTTVGALGGGALGGWAGSSIGQGRGQLAATAAGTLIGALLGAGLGQSLDTIDRMSAGRAFDQATAVPVGQPVVWSNRNSGNYGSVTPVADGWTATGRYCREFETQIVVEGRRQTGIGTACRGSDGAWRLN